MWTAITPTEGPLSGGHVAWENTEGTHFIADSRDNPCARVDYVGGRLRVGTVVPIALVRTAASGGLELGPNTEIAEYYPQLVRLFQTRTHNGTRPHSCREIVLTGPNVSVGKSRRVMGLNTGRFQVHELSDLSLGVTNDAGHWYVTFNRETGQPALRRR